MREQTGGNTHERTRDCARAQDLVTFLYGEADPAAARDFQTHLHACAACREELNAFGAVRARVGEWRAEGLGDAPALDFGEAFTPPLIPTARVRSARAALREFFALAPLWLRAGAVAAVLLVCALTALALARTKLRWDEGGLAFETGVPERVVNRIEKVEVPTPSRPDPAQVEALVQQRVREELAAVRREEKPAVSKDAPRVERAGNAARPKRNAPRQTARGRRQMEDEEGLPRLSDLLSGVY
jgi:hypothetical protein